TANPVNDPPSFAKGADVSVDEDAGPQAVPAWATAILPYPVPPPAQQATDEASQAVSFVVQGITYSSSFFNTDAKFFTALPAVNGTTGTLTYQLAPNANGTATVTIFANDSGGDSDTTPSQTFAITANPVNDPPSFAKGSNVAVNEDAGTQTVPAWA